MGANIAVKGLDYECDRLASVKIRDFIRHNYVDYLKNDSAKAKKISKNTNLSDYVNFKNSLIEKSKSVSDILHLNPDLATYWISSYEQLLTRGCLTFCYQKQDSLDLYVRDEFARFAYENSEKFRKYTESEEFYENGRIPFLDDFKKKLEEQCSQYAHRFNVSSTEVIDAIESWHSMFYIGEFASLYD